ncbi:glutamate receptor ionotropic, kainate 4-like [Panulirus ornatus]|uniref:glutamate receptor ionotropic, kainate 4-like n=1 Tax=Panulirus ornatus TaxID=150431 RepID=UPI003A8B4932
MGVQLLQQLDLSSHVQWHDILFYDKLQDFMGHTVRVVTLSYFPFIAYEKDSADPDGPLSLLDSLDFRILTTAAAHLNFSYEVREPWDKTWGVPLSGGNWSGIVGTLQHHQADFSLNLTPSAPRMKVISHSRIYSHDPLLIVSLKPGALPRHLALLMPFEGKVWMMIIVCTAASGVILWLLQRTWSWASGRRSIGLESACFFIWAVLLAEPSADSPTNSSSQVFVGSWLLSCVVIGIGYRSSLVSHLSVQGKTLPINTFQDLLARDGWSWGGIQFGGTTFLYFNQSTDPDVQEINRDMQIYDLEQGMERVLDGGFSYIAYKTDIKVKISSLYYDRYGNTPLHLSTTEYPIFGGNSWGFRQGAPFLSQFRRMKQRLLEAGLIDYWLDDVIETKVRVIRGNRGVAGETVYSEVDGGQVVLALDHLQGVFYLLVVGYIVALLTYIGENIDHYHYPSSEDPPAGLGLHQLPPCVKEITH